MTDRLSYRLTDGVAVLSMDDGKANALGPEMLFALSAALRRAEGEAKAICLLGRPGRFCAGFDLKVMMSSPAAAQQLVKHGADVFLSIYGCPLPVVMGCTGHALAGGALVLLTADTRIGVEGPFRIGLNETSIGMQLPILGQELARDRLDPRQLTAATVQATIYGPNEAAAAGFLDRVVAPEDLVATAVAEATRLGAIPGAAYGGTKKTLRGRTIRFIRETLDADIERLTSPTPG